jgi:putative ABC transport system permease protein
VVNDVLGGLKFPIAFFPAFFIPLQAIWWGLAIGLGTALVGSVLPAWSARTVRVSEVFSRVA